MAIAVPSVYAQTTVTEQADGSAAVSVEDSRIVVPAAVVDRVEAAARDHADDPQALREAIEAIIAEYAPGPGDAALASAIAVLAIDRSRARSAVFAERGLREAPLVLAIDRSRARSASIDAVIRGAFAANPNVSSGALLAAVPGLGASPRAQEAEQRRLAQLQATVENPSQISPVQ